MLCIMYMHTTGPLIYAYVDSMPLMCAHIYSMSFNVHMQTTWHLVYTYVHNVAFSTHVYAA